MNKVELLAALAEKSGLPKKEAEDFLGAFVEVVSTELKDGGKVRISGFGVFETISRAQRMCRNPQTGEMMMGGGGIAPKFKAGKALKDRLNQENGERPRPVDLGPLL